MTSLNRRSFLGLSGAALAGMNFPVNAKNIADSGEKLAEPVPMIHAGDIFNPYGDADDHWDLANIYALAYSGSIDLKGIVFDCPPRRTTGDPDVMAVAQMNYLTGKVIPSVTGTYYSMRYRDDIQPGANRLEHQGINWVIETLRKSPYPVVINVVGASTNIAIAVKKEPELFKSKCKAIYQNAGAGFYTEKDQSIEANVNLDPSAYAAIFDAPCPVYWLPCFHQAWVQEIGEYGSFYLINQKNILPYLPKRVLNFFLSMYGKKRNYKWLEYLNNEPEQELLARFINMHKGLVCTPGFFHAAGKKVTSEGEIVPLDSEKDAVFSFRPVELNCDDKGFTTWEVDHQAKNRFIFHVEDLDNYQNAMAVATKNLLLQLPQS